MVSKTSIPKIPCHDNWFQHGGGANVLSEAIVCGYRGASDIDKYWPAWGDYEGYFRVRDEVDLAETLYRAENDINFLNKWSHKSQAGKAFSTRTGEKQMEGIN